MGQVSFFVHIVMLPLTGPRGDIIFQQCVPRDPQQRKIDPEANPSYKLKTTTCSPINHTSISLSTMGRGTWIEDLVDLKIDIIASVILSFDF
jgi:hypothetical protein